MSIYKNEATHEEMKQEAVLRMQILGIDGQIIRLFQDEGAVSLSQQIGGQVILSPAADEFARRIQCFEEEYECLVYHVLQYEMSIVGDCWSLLFVSPTSSDWKGEQSYLKHSNMVYAYSYSKIEEGISEIVVEPRDGGLARIG